MSLASPTPSIVPDFDVTVHIVLDDFGAAGKIYREIDEADAGLEATINGLLPASTTTRFASSPSTRLRDRSRSLGPRAPLSSFTSVRRKSCGLKAGWSNSRVSHKE
jgi:hypothetical protein